MGSDKSTLTSDPRALAGSIEQVRALRREILRREVLQAGRIDLLATDILGYELRPFHAELLAFQDAATDIALQLAPRGYGKSTVLTIARAVYEILRNPNIRILIASNTQLQAEVFLREIKFHLALNEKLIDAFGRFQDEAKWDAREILVKPRRSAAKEATVTCVGVGGPVASRHYDLILADDLVDEENARTEGQREKVRTWYFKTLLPCLEPDGRLFLVGTRYHYLDLYGHLIKNELAEKHQVIRAIAADGSTPWPEKFSLKWLENRKQQMGSAIFATQYQNDVELMKGDIFREEWFRYYEEQQEWQLFEHWIGCDPAATRADVLLSGRKAETDYWTIVVGARRKEKDSDGGFGREVYVREVWRGRCTKQEYVDRLQAMHDRYKPRRVIVEDVAAQEYLAQDLEKLMRIKRLKRTKDKVSRAYDLQGYLENGQILFPAPHLQLNRDAYTALQDELVLFPNADHDDLFDALQTAVEGAFDRSGEMGVWFPTPAYEEEDDPHPWAHSRSTWPWWPR